MEKLTADQAMAAASRSARAVTGGSSNYDTIWDAVQVMAETGSIDRAVQRECESRIQALISPSDRLA